MLWLKRMFNYKMPTGRWQHMATPYNGEEIVVLDCETSLFDKKKGELLSVAAVRVKGHKIYLAEAINITIDSNAKTDPDAVRVHYLRREDRLKGVTAAQAIEKVLDFIGNRPICGFYIAYDRAILNRYISQLHGFDLPNKFLDVGDIYLDRKYKYHPQVQHHITFEHLAKELDVPVIERHTALGDVITTALMYIKLTQFKQ